MVKRSSAPHQDPEDGRRHRRSFPRGRGDVGDHRAGARGPAVLRRAHATMLLVRNDLRSPIDVLHLSIVKRSGWRDLETRDSYS